jgi:RNA polymerase sigma factor for flagellar operon FliA
MTLKEIGMVMGISESRVCQIHTRLILKLRSGFRKIEKGEVN